MSLIRLQSEADSLGFLERSVTNYPKEVLPANTRLHNSRNSKPGRSKTIDQIEYSPEPKSPASAGLSFKERRFQQQMEKLRQIYETKTEERRRNTSIAKTHKLASLARDFSQAQEAAAQRSPYFEVEEEVEVKVHSHVHPVIKIQREIEQQDCNTSFDNLMPLSQSRNSNFLEIQSSRKGKFKTHGQRRSSRTIEGLVRPAPGSHLQKVEQSWNARRHQRQGCSSCQLEDCDQKYEATRLREMKQYQKKCLILPDDPWKMKWNVFLINVIVMSSIFTPLQMCFFDTGEIQWELVEIFIDIVFLTDIVFSFFSAYYNKIEALVSSRREIACGYLKTWFFIDIIAIFPLHFVANTTLNSLGKLARLPRIYHIIKASKQDTPNLRFIRMMKFVKHKATAKKEISKLTESGVQVERLVAFFLLFLILCHNLACLWFLVAKIDDFGESTWVYRYGYDEVPIEEQYLASLYFIITTITTVGYGDITSKSPAEQGFCIVLMLIGVIAYSIAIGSFTSIMSASDKKEERLRAKLRLLSHVRDEYNLNFELYWRLRQALHYDHTMDMSDKHTLLGELPSKLKIELSNIMYSQQLQGIKYFKDKCPRFIATVAPLLKPVKVSKGEYIYLKGDSIDGVYFIKKGRAAYVEKKSKADEIFATVQPGSYLGDIDFTQSQADCRRLISMKAQTDMDLLLLERADLFQLDIDFKEQFFNLFQYSHQNLYKLKEMMQQSTEESDRQLSPISENLSHIQASFDSFYLQNDEQTPMEREETIDSQRVSKKSKDNYPGTPSNFTPRMVKIPKPTTMREYLEGVRLESEGVDHNNISNRSLVLALSDRQSFYSESASNSKLGMTEKWGEQDSSSNGKKKSMEETRHLSLKDKNDEKCLSTLFYKRGATAAEPLQE